MEILSRRATALPRVSLHMEALTFDGDLFCDLKAGLCKSGLEAPTDPACIWFVGFLSSRPIACLCLAPTSPCGARIAATYINPHYKCTGALEALYSFLSYYAAGEGWSVDG